MGGFMEEEKVEWAAHSTHLNLILLFNVPTVLSTDPLILLTHVIEDLGEIFAGNSIHLHIDIPRVLPSQLAHLLMGMKGI